jgi:hypothetical protein
MNHDEIDLIERLNAVAEKLEMPSAPLADDLWRGRRRVRRNRVLVAGAAAAAVAVVLGGAAAAGGPGRAESDGLQPVEQPGVVATESSPTRDAQPTTEAQQEPPGIPTADVVGVLCDEAMAIAAAEPDQRLALPLVAATLDACSGVAEWLAALNRYPGAMGWDSTPPGGVGRLDVQNACYINPDTTVCVDARGLGLT